MQGAGAPNDGSSQGTQHGGSAATIPPPQGSPAAVPLPPQGGYGAIPPQGGSAAVPLPPQGGYGAIPPQGGSAAVPLPPQGGYGAIPPQGGSAAVPLPPQGGYGAIPPQGGSAAVPLPPQGGYGASGGYGAIPLQRYGYEMAPAQRAYQMSYTPYQGGYQEKLPGGPPLQQVAYSASSPPQVYPVVTENQVQLSMETSAGAPPESYKGEMADDDVDENFDAPEPVPSAPPLENMDKIGGYSDLGFNMALPPPSYDDVMSQELQGRQDASGEIMLTPEEAREALLSYVNEHCCYGSGAAQKLNFTKLVSSSAFHYTLETFGESRQTSWAFEPFTGQPIDGPMNGPAPAPWEIPANPQCLFTDSMIEMEVPHTASVKPCHNCCASGIVQCHKCRGRGTVRCGHCFGKGYRNVHRNGKRSRQNCHWCHGRGRRRCSKCSGNGTVVCPACGGYRNLKCFIKLTVFWKNHVADHVVERTPLPNNLIRNVSGQTVLQETYLRVKPINHFQDEEVNVFSAKLISEQVFPLEKVLQQRQTVRMVPVTQCLFQWKNKDLDYFVYGLEHKVYAPDYPQQCCCGCTVL